MHAAYFNCIPNTTTRQSPKNSPPNPQAVTSTRYVPPPPYDFTFEDLAFSLYGKSVVQPIDTERIQRKRRMNYYPRNGDSKRKTGFFGIREWIKTFFKHVLLETLVDCFEALLKTKFNYDHKVAKRYTQIVSVVIPW